MTHDALPADHSQGFRSSPDDLPAGHEHGHELSDPASRLLADGGYVVRFYPSGRFYLTDKGKAALEQADAMDRLILEAYAQVAAKLGHPEAVVKKDRAELAPHLEALVKQGYLVTTGSGEYALTDVGEAAVAAYDQSHPARPGTFAVIDPAGIDRRTRQSARELQVRRHAAAVSWREQPGRLG